MDFLYHKPINPNQVATVVQGYLVNTKPADTVIDPVGDEQE